MRKTQTTDSSMNFYEFHPLLPNYCYPIRRGRIINPMYVTAMLRSEVELIFDTIRPIPLPSYPKIKKELNEWILNHKKKQ